MCLCDHDVRDVCCDYYCLQFALFWALLVQFSLFGTIKNVMWKADSFV